MQSSIKTSCIIPAFNEKVRITSVIESVLKCKRIDEIICVDDGSSDGTSDVVTQKFPEVKVIRLEKNSGKANAVFSGAKIAKGDYLLLIDADLTKIETEKIDKAVKKIITDRSIDMIIFRMKNFMLLSKLLRHDILLSGNSVLRKRDLLEMFKERHPKGYELEIAVCRYMRKHRKRVFHMWFSAIGYSTIKKNGFFGVIKRDFRMYRDIIKHAGIINYVDLTLNFCKDEIEIVNDRR